MAGLLATLGGNPLHTPVGQKIGKCGTAMVSGLFIGNDYKKKLVF